MRMYRSVFKENRFYEAASISDIENAVKSIAEDGKLFVTFSNESGKKSEAFEVTGEILSQIAKSKAITSRIG